jgi:hypothetical protein
VVFWIQGTTPDESFLRNRSRLRRAILMVLERLSLLSCSVALVVSTEEAELLCRRHGSWVRPRIIVLPNLLWIEALTGHTTQLSVDRLREQVTFAYVGSVGVWQNFDLMLALYAAVASALQQRGRRSTLRVVVPASQRQLAQRIVQRREFLDQPELSSCQPSEVSTALVGVDFGFLLRDDSVVNRVASPLKLRDYLGAGVRVIASGEIGVLHDIPELESNGLVLHVRWADLQGDLALAAEQLCTEILRRRAEPFSWDVLATSFTYEAWMSVHGTCDALRSRLVKD